MSLYLCKHCGGPAPKFLLNGCLLTISYIYLIPINEGKFTTNDCILKRVYLFKSDIMCHF